MAVNTRVLEWTETDLGVAGERREVVRAPATVLSTVGETVDPTSPDVVRLAAHRGAACCARRGDHAP